MNWISLKDEKTINYIIESNKIENIHRDPTESEVIEFDRFMMLDKLTTQELERFVSVYQSDARLRNEYGMNVKIGSYYPPFGDPHIGEWVQNILDRDYDAYDLHVQYEKLHPFTDGNGRIGRMLWAWKHRDLSLGFLHMFYYQTLARAEKKF